MLSILEVTQCENYCKNVLFRYLQLCQTLSEMKYSLLCSQIIIYLLLLNFHSFIVEKKIF